LHKEYTEPEFHSKFLSIGQEAKVALEYFLSPDFLPPEHIKDIHSTHHFSFSTIPFWLLSSHITLICNSVHALSSTSDIRATTDVRDATTLAQILVDRGIDEGGMSRSKAEMREYYEEVIGLSSIGGKHLIGTRDFEELRATEE
jgi:hypothetical protein